MAKKTAIASKKLARLKDEICDIGRRMYAKGFAAGNDGNIACRVGPDAVLCTPTMISKGFMKPADLCIVDMEGNQIGGSRKRTSEILLHLTILKERPDVEAVVHCHPPHATAFAVAREPIPQGVLPEVELFLGEVPIARYETPGSQTFADTVRPFVKKSTVVILANHGTVSFGTSIEQAYWWTEVLDASCRILMLARDLGRVEFLTRAETKELLQLKTAWGFADPRLEPDMEHCDVCANDAYRGSWSLAGVARQAFREPPPSDADGGPARQTTAAAVDQAALVKAITEQVCRQLGIPAG